MLYLVWCFFIHIYKEGNYTIIYSTEIWERLSEAEASFNWNLKFGICFLIRSYFPLSATIFCPPRRTKGFSLLSGLGELFSRERSFLYIRIERCMSEKHEKKTLCLGAFVAKAEKSRKERNAICYKILSKECFALWSP